MRRLLGASCWVAFLVVLSLPGIRVGFLGGAAGVAGVAWGLGAVALLWLGAVLLACPDGVERPTVLAFLLDAPVLMLMPDWEGPGYLVAVLGVVAATHLLVGPLVARLTVDDEAVRRVPPVTGAAHAVMVGTFVVPLLRYDGPTYVPFILVGAVFFGMLAWGLSSLALRVAAGRSAPRPAGPGDALLLALSALVVGAAGAVFVPGAGALSLVVWVLAALLLAAACWVAWTAVRGAGS